MTIFQFYTLYFITLSILLNFENDLNAFYQYLSLMILYPMIAHSYSIQQFYLSSLMCNLYILFSFTPNEGNFEH